MARKRPPRQSRTSAPERPPSSSPPPPPPLFYRDGRRLSAVERGLETAEQAAARARAARRQTRIEQARRELEAAQARYDAAQNDPFPVWLRPLVVLTGLAAELSIGRVLKAIVLLALIVGFAKTCSR